jgi:diaminohydroxyphosphoribosylaminopyrimidine deaminase/5-amino-6-(5-phosphoribosylamino)uracil reductase
MPSEFSHADYRAMARALQLAARGLNSTRPNPRVGCVLVRDGEVVGEGWHEYAGGPHAEVVALEQAEARARGAACFVTLEPCSHQGRTGPCSTALIEAGVSRVVAALEDPNPRVAGDGLRALRERGIATELGLLGEPAAALNPGFLKRMGQGRPYVRAKLGVTLDGRLAAADGGSQWITSEASRADVQRLRAQSCAVLTGIDTVLADNPRLDVRDASLAASMREQPLRVVLDSRLRLPPTAAMLKLSGSTLVMTGRNASEIVDFRAGGAEVVSIGLDGTHLDLAAVMSELARREVNEVLVEAGPRLTGALLSAGLVDELICYMAPKLLGGDARAMLELKGLRSLSQAVVLDIADLRRVGPDLRLILKPTS